MQNTITTFKGENRYFWVASILMAFIIIAVGANVLEPHFFLVFLFSLVVIIFFWDTPYKLVSLALAAFPLGNIIPIAFGKHFVVSVSLTEIFIVLTVIIILFQTILGGHRLAWKEIWHDTVFRILTLYVIISALSFVQNIDIKLFFFELRVVIFWLVAYTIARIVFDNQNKMRWLFSGLSVAVFILAIQVFFLLAENGYSLALFYDRNHLLLPIGAIAFVSAILAMILPTLVGNFLSETSLGIRIFFGSAIVFGFIALLALLSKAAIGSFVLGMLYVVWKIRKKFFVPIISIFGGMVFGLLLFSSFLTRLIERTLNAFMDINSQYRILEYKLAGTVLRDHWLLGVGIGQQPVYFQKIYYADFINLVNNYLLQGWLDLGLVGLLLLLVLTIVIAKRTLTLVRENKTFPWAPLTIGLTASCVVAFFNGFAEVTFFGMFYAVVFFVLLGSMQNIQLWKKFQ